jgi:hypothetical protein
MRSFRAVGVRSLLCVLAGPVLFAAAGCDEPAVLPEQVVEIRACGDPPGGWQRLTTYRLTIDLVPELVAGEACFEPTADLITLDGDGHALRRAFRGNAGPAGIGIRLREPRSVSIKGWRDMGDFEIGIEVVDGAITVADSSRVRVAENVVTLASSAGIAFVDTDDGGLIENRVSGSQRDGAIRLISSSRNGVNGNVLDGNVIGLSAGRTVDGGASSENSFRRNRICDNDQFDVVCANLTEVGEGSDRNRFGNVARCLMPPESDPNWPILGEHYEPCDG